MKYIEKTKKLFEILEEKKIQYCVSTWDIDNRKLDMYVDNSCMESFAMVINKIGYQRDITKKSKYTYIYKLHPDLYFKDSEDNYIHCHSEMSCVSLSNLNNCKLPLDKSIQESIWKNKVYDKDNGYWKINSEDRWIEIVTTCVFNHRYFDQESIQELENISVEYENKNFLSKLEGVFFNFADELINHIKQKNYENIFQDYKTFKNY